MTVQADAFIGVWDLVRWRIRFSDDRPETFPYGESARGQLIYDASGRMAVTVIASDRSPISDANVRRAPEHEKAAAFDTSFHYAGTWSLDDGVVEHHVSMALNPNFVDTTQVRLVTFEDDTLTLAERTETRSGATMWNELTWRRVA